MAAANRATCCRSSSKVTFTISSLPSPEERRKDHSSTDQDGEQPVPRTRGPGHGPRGGATPQENQAGWKPGSDPKAGPPPGGITDENIQTGGMWENPTAMGVTLYRWKMQYGGQETNVETTCAQLSPVLHPGPATCPSPQSYPVVTSPSQSTSVSRCLS